MKFKLTSMIALFVLIALFLYKPSAVSAATDPGLGAAASFSVLAQTAVTNVPTSVISGDVGLNSAGTNYSGLNSSEVADTIYDTNGTGPDGAAAILPTAVQANASTAFTANIPGQAVTASIGPVLDALTITPGVYDIGAGRLNGGVLHLNGPGIYIFRASSDFISSGSISLENGARACDVYWRVETLATINGSSFTGSILAGTGVHFGSHVTLDGRALAVGGDATLIGDTISGPSCATPVVPPAEASINVVKTVVNDNGRTKVVSDFPLFVNGSPVVSGVTNTFPANAAYTITETSDPNYTQTFSGDCDATGHLSLAPGDIKVCIVTNDDKPPGGGLIPPVPPLIDVVKVPAPLALPAGPGPVTYTYTLRNIGTVPVTNVTMVGDTCSPIVLVSGDTNSNSILDLSETWVYTCSTNLSTTHTNTVTATGVANGITAVDVASATVVVGVPALPNTGRGGGGGGGGSRRVALPPLIHVTKIPTPLALSVGGGFVTYTEGVTNPGAVALASVNLSDDKCSPVNYISGDTNDDSKLDTNEAWIYTCRTNLAGTTTNTVVAEGTANGLTARDFAVATVVVAAPRLPDTGFVPGLPNTGYPPQTTNIIFLAGAILLISTAIIVVLKKRTT